MTIRTLARSAWTTPLLVGVLLVGVFVVAMLASPVVRQFWPLPILSALAAALPFILVDSATHRRRPLPMSAPMAVEEAAAVAPALRASAVSLPKAAAAAGENDDAYGIDPDAGYAALADGASSSFRAGEWARLLCTTFVEQRPLTAAPSQAWIAKATAVFRGSVGHGADWWSSEAEQRGAHAAFAGLAVLRRHDELSWRAMAVGDCVLVHLRAAPAGQEPIVTAFPIAHSAAFPQNPVLLSSAADGTPPVVSIEGAARFGDTLLLMSDELAQWALRRFEAGDPLWALLAHGTQADLASAVATARSSGVIADDDMTVVRVELVSAG